MTKKPSSAPAAAGPASFVPTTDFVEFPFGPDEPMQFFGGILSPPVPAEFIERMKAEGRITDTAADTATDQPEG